MKVGLNHQLDCSCDMSGDRHRHIGKVVHEYDTVTTIWEVT